VFKCVLAGIISGVWDRPDVDCALAALTDNELAVVLLARQRGVSYRDVARITGHSPPEVLTILRAGLAKLHAALPEPVVA
jgi:DNA-directed RNA polymerase specialized sigma24 family protein